MKAYIVGNWKMNQNLESIRDFFIDFSQVRQELHCHAWIAPQAFHIPIVKEFAFTTGNITLGAQDCSSEERGAFTGEISAYGLKDLGGEFCLIGHSERRAYHQESSQVLQRKVGQALQADLIPIFCVGETQEEKDQGRTQEVLEEQIKEGLGSHLTHEKLLLAYEPVWAIGSGQSAQPRDIEKAFLTIKSITSQIVGRENIPLLYGGSVSPDNAREILSLPSCSGLLIGGASLDGKKFAEICAHASTL